MFGTQCVLVLVVLYVGLVHSWDIAVTHGGLLEFYTNSTKTDTVRFDSHNLAALTYDEVNNMILYVDKQSDNDTICGYGISSKVTQCFIERNGRNIHGLAFDPVTELLFFTDTNERSVNWITLKSESSKYGNLLTKLYHGIPTDVAVDSCRGYVFWINTALTTPTIERARFDGSEREVLINIDSLSINTTYKLEPHSLTIDQQTQRMHWIAPQIGSYFSLFYTDLNGKTLETFHRINVDERPNPSSNTLTVSNTDLFWVNWRKDIEITVWKIEKITKSNAGSLYLDLHIQNVTVGIVANYKIKERIQYIKDCEALTNLAQKKNCDGPFCVHGVKVIGQSLCKCTPGYIGERCDVSVCENYCLQGNCSVNDEGLPTCSCNAGYSGDRCEVAACLGYCLNSGVCSLNEEDEPACKCVGRYQGLRCDAVQTVTLTFPYTPSYSADTNRTLVDLLSNWRKPKILVVGDES